MNRIQATIIYLFLLGLLASSCSRNPPEPLYTPPDSSFGLIYTHIFDKSCNRCHSGTSTHPRLKGENTYHAIVTDHLHNQEAAQAGLHLIKPFDPDSSFLYQKMIYDSSDFQFGSPMPQGGLTVSANKIKFLRLWIEEGAPEFGHVADSSLILN